MKDDDKLEIPVCKKCGRKQIRTTKKYRICNCCGDREKLL